MGGQYKNRVELIGIFAYVFKTRARPEWEERMEAAGDLIFERVQRTLHFADNPQVIENGYIIDFDHPVLGNFKQVQTPITYSKTPVSAKKIDPAQRRNT